MLPVAEQVQLYSVACFFINNMGTSEAIPAESSVKRTDLFTIAPGDYCAIGGFMQYYRTGKDWFYHTPAGGGRPGIKNGIKGIMPVQRSARSGAAAYPMS